MPAILTAPPVTRPTMAVRVPEPLTWLALDGGRWKAHAYRADAAYRIAVEGNGSFTVAGSDPDLFADDGDLYFANFSTLAGAQRHCEANERKAVVA